MQRIFGTAFLLLLLRPLTLSAAPTFTSEMTIGKNEIHYGVYEPVEESQGDILYFHGFGDRFTNHERLFGEWTQAGFRVIGFDLPNHGGTVDKAFGAIDFHSFASLSEIARTILSSQRAFGDDRPLIFAGWSLGGLLATRILQTESLRAGFPTVSGLILYAPAVAPQSCVGNFLCQLTNETLSHNPNFSERELRPKSPLQHLPFAARLVANAAISWKLPLPADLQILIFTAGDDDAYVRTPFVVRWVGTHRSNYVSRMSAFQCDSARHELDNEPAIFGGEFVRDISREFAIKISQGNLWTKDDGAQSDSDLCRAF